MNNLKQEIRKTTKSKSNQLYQTQQLNPGGLLLNILSTLTKCE